MIRLTDGWTARQPLGSWQLPGDPHFAFSRAYDIFSRDLRRYVREEIAGRSFLIAGHRGAGKTALVGDAIRRLRSDLIEASVDETAPLGRKKRLQRPLMVKLVGRSLIAPAPVLSPKPATPDETQPKPAAGAADAQSDSTPNPDDSAKAPAEGIDNALVHITIALYRALAAEAATGFAVHVRDGPATGLADRNELAAQLALDLDTAPDPATLRQYWANLDRLALGVLWPTLADSTLRSNLVSDQGIREIVAIATAAQAFQVCSGSVTYSMSASETASRIETAAAKIDVKDLIGRLGSILAGTVAGGAAFSAGPLPAVGVGLLVWLASNAALTWTSSRSRNRQQGLSYTFLRDRSVQTLDRDLPLVIERIREAGLAPVFVIDELDKLEGEAEVIKKIIDRLKNLVSDYGFFCFVSDRKYFDSIESKVQDQVYPSEHTYFSARLLILHRPSEIFDFVTGLFVSDDQTTDADRSATGLFALVATYRSKLNFTDLNREIAGVIDRSGALSLNAPGFSIRPDLRLPAALQLACEETLRAEPVATRFKDDECFAQLATDALYYIPRAWEENAEGEVKVTREALRTYLLARIRGQAWSVESAGAPATGSKTAGVKGKSPAASLASSPSEESPAKLNEADLTLLFKLVLRQAEFLESFKLLETVVRRSDDIWRRFEHVPTELQGLVRRRPGSGDLTFEFHLDEEGSVRPAMPAAQPSRTPWDVAAAGLAPLPPPPAAASALGPTSAAPRPGREASEFVDAFRQVVGAAGTSVDALVAIGVLPASLSTLDIEKAQDIFTSFADAPADQQSLATNTARVLRSALDRSGGAFSNAVLLGMLVEKSKAPGVAGADVTRAIGRYLPAPGASNPRSFDAELTTLIASWPAFPLKDAASLQRLNAFIADSNDTSLPQLVARLSLDEQWDLWHNRLVAWFARRDGPVEGIGAADLLGASDAQAPGALFRADLGMLTNREWTQIALAAAPQGAPPASPFWVGFAGLRGLGFGGDLLRRLRTSPPPFLAQGSASPDFDKIDAIIDGTPSAPSGIVLIGPDRSALATATPATPPVLVMALDEAARYSPVMDWLVVNEAFQGVVDG